MGDMADDLIEQEMDFWEDHKAGHPRYDGPCPYCEDDSRKKDKLLPRLRRFKVHRYKDQT